MVDGIILAKPNNLSLFWSRHLISDFNPLSPQHESTKVADNAATFKLKILFQIRLKVEQRGS